MTNLSLKILSILAGKSPNSKVYLRGREELGNYPNHEIIAEAEELTEKGYLKIIQQESFIVMDNNLVNYFFEITESGHEYFHRLTSMTC